MLAALPCVGWSVHVGQKRDFIYPQGVDDDMHMNIAAVVMPVRVGAYKGLVSGEMLLAEPVSYTHLDVYKRQAIPLPTPLPGKSLKSPCCTRLFLSPATKATEKIKKK